MGGEATAKLRPQRAKTGGKLRVRVKHLCKGPESGSMHDELREGGMCRGQSLQMWAAPPECPRRRGWQKSPPLCTPTPNRHAGTELEETEKVALTARQRGDTAGECLKDCAPPHLGGGSEESDSVWGAGRGQLMDSFLIGWW